jgi:hypothetical protein
MISDFDDMLLYPVDTLLLSIEDEDDDLGAEAIDTMLNTLQTVITFISHLIETTYMNLFSR